MKANLFFTALQFLKYLTRANGAHSAHSPFVYGLIKQCIKPAKKTSFKDIESIRKRLLSDHQLIEVADFKNATSAMKRISGVARNSLSSRKFSSFLYHLTDYIKAQSGLETGTSLGINTAYLAKSSLKQLTSIEGSQILSSIAKKNISEINPSVQMVNGDLYTSLEKEIVRAKPDLYFLDADHRSSAIAFCIDLILKHTPDAKCIVIHDVYWSKDMKMIWNQLIKDPRFVLSIDIFQAGLLFLNLEMPKQHFTLRF